MPFAAHGLRARAELLGVQQHPDAAARRARPGAGIVLGETRLHIGGPAHVSEMTLRRAAADDIDEGRHAARMPDSHSGNTAVISTSSSTPSRAKPATRTLVLAGGDAMLR